MQKKEKIEEKVLQLVSEQYYSLPKKNEIENITLDTDIRRELGFDSIMLVIFQIGLEDVFHIRFNPVKDDLKKVFTTIRNISDYVCEVLRNEYE